MCIDEKCHIFAQKLLNVVDILLVFYFQDDIGSPLACKDASGAWYAQGIYNCFLADWQPILNICKYKTSKCISAF